MPTLSLISRYKKNENIVINPQELIFLYFYGVKINNSTDGTKLQDETIMLYIQAAQEEVERYFDIKIFPTLISENRDYYRDDYTNNFPFVRTSQKVRIVHSFIGMLNGVEQIRYPKAWLQAKSSSNGAYYRQFSVVPNGSIVNSDADVILTGISAYYGIRSYPMIPNYWYVQYETGFPLDKIPADLMNLIGMLASIPLLAISGDLILQGMSSNSLSIDGLSQSVSAPSTGAYGARINEYRKSIDLTIERIRMTYSGINFSVL